MGIIGILCNYTIFYIMPELYDINFDQQAGELLPPDKRNPTILAPVRALLSGLQWTRDLIFGSYRTGATAPAWSAGTYNKFEQVIYKKAVYESLVADNAAEPNINQDTAYWRKVQSNFVGVEQRILYNCQRLTFEYALNKWFGTVFRQPPNTSDIYLTTTPPAIKGFVVGGPQPSIFYRDRSYEFITNEFFPLVSITLTINIPSAVYIALGSTTTERDNIVRSFADKYNAFGIFYDINPY